MDSKPQHHSGYSREQAELIRQTCLCVATRLGDFLDDLIVVGGLVPSLICRDHSTGDHRDLHVGTLDLDLGLEVSLLDDRRYADLIQSLRDAGFSPDRTQRGDIVRQRWRIEGPESVTIDFLIPPSRDGDRGGSLRDIRPDFAAIIAPGLRCAFRDKEHTLISGSTLRGGRADRWVQVCGPAAFVVMKALAFRNRGQPKDAYDLDFMLRHFGEDLRDVSTRLIPLLDEPSAVEALRIVEQDFTEPDLIGPLRVAEFLTAQPDEDIQADVAGLARALLKACGVS